MKIIVIGGCNIDFICRATANIEPATSNAADISLQLGGVGRNIAENLTRLGAEVTLITSLGDDIYLPRLLKKN